MKFPWSTSQRSRQEWEDADQRVRFLRTHVKLVLHDLDDALRRIELRRRRELQ